MKKTSLIGTLTFCGFAALVSCDNGATPTSGSLADDDCPIGTFRPPGLVDCVIPADDQFGNPLGVSDNRCATGQPALPPVCVGDEGGRTYFSTAKSCAPGYRFEPGACQRGGGGVGTGGFFGTTGAAPTGIATTGFSPTTGAAGETSGQAGAAAAGGVMTGGAGVGEAGTVGPTTGGGGVTGAAGN